MCWGQTIKQCVQFRYKEIKHTNGGRLKSANYGASHYSQLVWKRTHQVGCGKAHGIIVCQYKKRGNWAGQCPDCYASNVYGPKRSKSHCSGEKNDLLRSAPSWSNLKFQPSWGDPFKTDCS